MDLTAGKRDELKTLAILITKYKTIKDLNIFFINV